MDINIVKPGTENIVLSTSVIDLMTCVDDHLGKNKVRHCFVHKKQYKTMYNQFTNGQGFPVSIVTTQVFDDVQEILLNAMRQIQNLQREVEKYKTKCEAYQMTIETLKKNGVID